MRLNSITYMATATIVSVGLLTILIFGFFSYNHTKINLEKKFINEAELVMEHSLIGLQSIFTNSTEFINELAQEREIREAFSAPESYMLNVSLEWLQKALSNSRALKLGLENGRFFMGPLVRMPATYDPRELNWYKMAKQQEKQVVWTEPYLDYVDQKIMITAAKAVHNTSGAIHGVVAVDYELSTISKRINASHIGVHGFVMLLNQTGIVIANKENYWIGEAILGGNFEPIRDKALEQQTLYNIKGEPYYLKMGKIKENGMLIVTAISKKEIQHALWETQLPIFILGFICLAAFGVITYIFALKAIHPLQRLVTLMKSAEQGNYDIYASMNHYEEIQSLARGFNTMMESIKRRDQALHESNEQIIHLAYYDTLTGLLNRGRIMDIVNSAIEQERHETMLLVYVDLDNFKLINDSMGHASGDEVLVEVAKRLLNISYPIKDVARIGGDEFIMVLYDVDSETEGAIQKMMNPIIESLGEPMQLGRHEFQASASVGAALFPKHAKQLEDLLQKADIAMYKAKALGKNRYQIFHECMQEDD